MIVTDLKNRFLIREYHDGDFDGFRSNLRSILPISKQ